MACDDCGKADFTAVPTPSFYDLREDVRALTWGWVGLWAFTVLLVMALFRKGVIGWADLVPVRGA